MMRALAGMAALLVVVAMATVFAPASLIATRIDHATGGTVRVVQASGRLWHGQASLTGADGRWRLPVAWRLAAWPLLRGEVRLDLVPVAQWPPLRGRIAVHGDTLAARAVDVRVPMLAFKLPPGVAAAGDLHLTTDSAVARTDGHDGAVRLEWRHARLALVGGPVVDLGTATLTLAAAGKRWHGPLSARGGEVVVDGDVGVDANGADATMTIVVQPGAPEALRQRLGPADANGAVRLTFSPRFR